MKKKIIPYGKQHITPEDIDAVVTTLKSDYLTQGPRINEFEEKFAEYVGAKYAVAVSNGTAALHLSTLSLDLRPGQKVITTPLTFAASANCIRYCGGEVVFVDIDPETYLLDFEKVKNMVQASPKGTFAGIIPVDFAGRATDLEKLKILAQHHGLWIIEDSCHAPGGYFIDSKGREQLCGNGNFADLAIFSFHPVKHIACGEGGMITTNDAKLYKRLLQLRTHGILKEEASYINTVQFAAADDKAQNYPGWYMEMQVLGYNYRLTDFQAVLGTSQLRRANLGIKLRKEIASKYYEAFKHASFIYGQSGVIKGHAYHLYILEVDNRLGLYNFLRDRGIYAQIHYIPLHLMPYYKQKGWQEGDFPVVESYYKKCISLPMFPSLSIKDQQYVVDCIFEFYEPN